MSGQINCFVKIKIDTFNESDAGFKVAQAFRCYIGVGLLEDKLTKSENQFKDL